MRKGTVYTLLLLLLAASLLFASCTMRPKTADTGTEGTAAPSASPSAGTETATATPAATPEPTATPEATATPAPAVYTNPLTGETTSTDYSMTRPVAVMIENNRTDNSNMITQHGIADAAILYEMEVEKITRCMGVYMDVSAVEQICPIRSARTYFVGTAMAYDAIYIHQGYSAEGLDWAGNMLAQYFTNDDINLGDENSYRLTDWPHTGEHSLATSGELLTKYFESAGVRTEHESAGYDYGLRFNENLALTGDPATAIKIVFPEFKITELAYDGAKEGYTSTQWGGAYVDGNTGDPVAFQNVLILAAQTAIGIDTKWHSAITLTDCEGAGTFCHNGVQVPIKWSRGDLYDSFHYYNEDGSELELGVGRTYVAVVSTSHGGVTIT